MPIEFCAMKMSFQLKGKREREKKNVDNQQQTLKVTFFFVICSPTLNISKNFSFSYQFPGCRRRTQVKYFNALVLVFYNKQKRKKQKHKKEISINYLKDKMEKSSLVFNVYEILQTIFAITNIYTGCTYIPMYIFFF